MLVDPSLYTYVILLTVPVKVASYGKDAPSSSSYAASTISCGSVGAVTGSSGSTGVLGVSVEPPPAGIT